MFEPPDLAAAVQRTQHLAVERRVPQNEHGDPPQREQRPPVRVTAPTVAVVDSVVPLEVRLDRALVRR